MKNSVEGLNRLLSKIIIQSQSEQIEASWIKIKEAGWKLIP